ncbi:hypothetical protein [Lentilactobacillus hilgardii]|uniref:hypothetical protein n=1 Tax=Lentilactobacillus hilgardii TaxID=1588 RepID=UPI00390C5BB5
MKEIIKRENTDNIKDKLMCDKISRKWWIFKRRTEKVWNNFFELEDEPDTFKDIMKIIFFSLVAAPLFIWLFRIILVIGIFFEN